MQHELLSMLAARQGHFRYESGFHSDLWLDLDLLFLRARAVQLFAIDLAKRLARHHITAVCGPLVGGALIAQVIAAELGMDFFYTERFLRPQNDGPYPVEYRLPSGLRPLIRGHHVAIVDDVISAGSAARGTFTELRSCGVGTVVVGALLVLGDSAHGFFSEQNIPLECIVNRPSNLWLPAECPLCNAQVPSEDVTADEHDRRP